MKNELLNRTKSKPGSSHILGHAGVPLPKQPQSRVRFLARAESRAEKRAMEMNVIASAPILLVRGSRSRRLQAISSILRLVHVKLRAIGIRWFETFSSKDQALRNRYEHHHLSRRRCRRRSTGRAGCPSEIAGSARYVRLIDRLSALIDASRTIGFMDAAWTCSGSVTTSRSPPWEPLWTPLVSRSTIRPLQALVRANQRALRTIAEQPQLAVDYIASFLCRLTRDEVQRYYERYIGPYFTSDGRVDLNVAQHAVDAVAAELGVASASVDQMYQRAL
jgi:hypothetical protein